MSTLTNSLLADAKQSAEIEVTPVEARIGAEIHNIKLSADLGAQTIAAIRQVLLKHKVIFFRSQHHLDDEGQEAFAASLGELVKHPKVDAASGSRSMLELNVQDGYSASMWHTDMTFMPAYPAASILRILDVPQLGGDTMWANTVTAYGDLPAPLKLFADNLRGIHSSAIDFDAIFNEELQQRAGKYGQLDSKMVFETEHPVVRVHPETGERALLIGIWMKRLAGFDAAQSQRIVALLQDYVIRPENTIRWRWQPGDVAVWDNRATQHRSVADFGDQPRRLRRATIYGSVPVGVDGAASRVLKSPQPEV